MHRACEALRTMDAPGSKDAGRLYRIALEKGNLYTHAGIPIEYARAQTDTPAQVAIGLTEENRGVKTVRSAAWNYEWTKDE